jgi:hypothetical protein
MKLKDLPYGQTKEVFCGIYLITNTKNNKVYVGQSVDIYARWRSYKSFCKNNTCNEPILEAMRECGIDNFDIIHKCEKSELNKMEKYYIKAYNSCMRYENSNGYNTDEGGFSYAGRKPKKVLCVDTGEIFEDVKEASKKYIISDTMIRRCCTGVMKTAKGVKWEYIYEETELDKIKYKLYEYKNDVQ